MLRRLSAPYCAYHAAVALPGPRHLAVVVLRSMMRLSLVFMHIVPKITYTAPAHLELRGRTYAQREQEAQMNVNLKLAKEQT